MAARANHDGPAGHIVVGRLLLRTGDSRGAALREATRAERAAFRRRPTPVLQRPRSIRGLLGRQGEVTAALSALDAEIPVEISGGPGAGKTALLRHLAHHARAASFRDGVVYLSARHESSVDLLQRIFESFYESDRLAKPTEAEIQRSLQDTQALVLLDDLRLPQQETEQILSAAPHCAFVLATRERRLWSEACHVELKGLPIEYARVFLEREIQRSLDAPETGAANNLCAVLDGHPLRIQHAAALIRERAMPAADWERHLAAGTLIAELLTSIDERERRALLALAAFTGAPIEAAHIAAIAELTDVDTLLVALGRRGLVLRDDSRYRLADGVADRLRRSEDLKPWLNRAVTYFTAWAQRQRRNRESLLQATDALVRVQAHALEAKRWGEALRLGRLLEATLVPGARWGAWAVVLERSLTAARALGDRAAEARVLHEIGTRAVCCGDAGTARRLLTQASAIREELGENGAAAVSRGNLEFVVTERIEESTRPRPALPFSDVGDIDMVALQHRADAARRGAMMSETGAMLLTFVLFVALGAFTYIAVSSRTSVAGAPAPQPPLATAATPATAPAPEPDATTPITTAPPDAPAPERASILIFTARPGSFAASGLTRLCYAVRDALQTRIEPGIGRVDAADTLTCRRVTAPRTTTYELTAVGRDGVPVRQQVVIVAR